MTAFAFMLTVESPSLLPSCISAVPLAVGLGLALFPRLRDFLGSRGQSRAGKPSETPVPESGHVCRLSDRTEDRARSMPVDPRSLEFFRGETKRLQGFGGRPAPEGTLPKSVEAVCNALGAERAIVFLSHAGGKELISYLSAGMEYGSPLILSADRGIPGEVLRFGTALVVNDLADDSRPDSGTEEPLGFRILNVLSAPLKDSLGGTFGVFQLLNKPGGFTPSDQALILPYASALSDALHPHVRSILV
jgi:hypothetical protein